MKCYEIMRNVNIFELIYVRKYVICSKEINFCDNLLMFFDLFVLCNVFLLMIVLRLYKKMNKK